MVQESRIGTIDESQPCWTGPTEGESHTEHQAALDATLFRSVVDPCELVLELESGELKLREADRD